MSEWTWLWQTYAKLVCLRAEEKKERKKNEELMRVLIKVISIHFPIMQQLLPARQLEITTAYHSISERSLLSTGRSQFDAQTWNCIPNIRCTLERASAEVFKSKFAYNLLNPSFFHHHLTSIRLEKLANNRMSQKTDKNVSKCLRRQKKKHRRSASLFDVGTSIMGKFIQCTLCFS